LILRSFSRWIRLACLAIGVAAASRGRAEDVLLQWKLQPGQALHQHMETRTKTTTQVGGNRLEGTQNMEIDFLWTVGKVGEDRKAGVTQKVQRIRLKMKMPGSGELEYDSDEGKDLPGPVGTIMGPMLKALVGAELTFQMTPDGKVDNVKVPDSLTAAASKLRGGGAGVMFGEEAFRQMCQPFPTFPDKPVGVGATWSDSKKVDLPFGGAIRTANKYVYEGPEERGGRRLLKFSVKGDVTHEKPEKVTVELNVKPKDSSGLIFFDPELGHFVEMASRQDIAMQMAFGGQRTENESQTSLTWKIEDAAKPAAGDGAGGKAQPTTK